MPDSPQDPKIPPAGKGKEAPPAAKDGCDLPNHPLVTALLKGDDPPLDLITLAGYIGKSEKEGYYRLYLDLSFGSYFEVPCREVRHSESLKAGDVNSPTLLYLSATTKVELVQITSSSAADFFQGTIALTYLPTSVPSGGGVYPTQPVIGVTTVLAPVYPAGHPTSTCLPHCHPAVVGFTRGDNESRPTETCHTSCGCHLAQQVHMEGRPTETCHTSCGCHLAHQVHVEGHPTETCHTSCQCPHPVVPPIGYLGIQNNITNFNYLLTGHPSVCTCKPICH